MTSNPFATSNEGQLLLEKCRILGMSPKDVLELTEAEDDFLTVAISQRYKDGRSTS